MRKVTIGLVFSLFSVLATGCSDSAGANSDAGPSADGGGVNPYANTAEATFTVAASGKTYVSLANAATVTPTNPATSNDWDLAFEGFDVFTNGGVSGGGKASAFGPLDALQFLDDAAPDVPFMTSDQAGGAFLKWYAYDSNGHVLYSRFHVYGVKSGSSLFKVQILTYYAVQNGAATSGLFQIRYSDITNGAGAEHDLTIDGAAGGVSGPATAPSGCLDLASGSVSMLAPSDAATSTAWDLCFRRETVSVNGEVGGPRGVGAVDLEASSVATEVLSDVEALTADGEKALFDGVDASAFETAQFRGDHVVSAFESGGWLDSSQSPPEPVMKAWLVLDAAGSKKFLVGFDPFQNPTTQSPGTVVMHIKPVGG